LTRGRGKREKGKKKEERRRGEGRGQRILARPGIGQRFLPHLRNGGREKKEGRGKGEGHSSKGLTVIFFFIFARFLKSEPLAFQHFP